MNLTRAFTLGATAALLAPAAAHAATLTTAPCYDESQPMTINGAGWGPGTGWTVKTTAEENQVFDYGTADAAGNFTSTNEVAPIVVGDHYTPVTFTLTGQQDDVDVASTTFKVVDLLAAPKSFNGKPKGFTTWRFSGFEPGKPIYVHVRRKGKVYTQKAGTGDATCGTLKKRLHRLPGVPPKQIHYGNYKIAVDVNPTYRKSDHTFNQVTGSVTIYKKYFR